MAVTKCDAGVGPGILLIGRGLLSGEKFQAENHDGPGQQKDEIGVFPVSCVLKNVYLCGTPGQSLYSAMSRLNSSWVEGGV